MADYVQINQAGVAIPYDATAKTQINQAGVAVIYSDQAQVGTVQINQAGVAVVCSFLPPIFRVFPLPPPNRLQQSQGMKRVFPV